MSWIGMFPGQGSQEPGMGKELLEKYPELLIDIFDESLGWSLKDIINGGDAASIKKTNICLLYTSPSPRDRTRSRMPSSA